MRKDQDLALTIEENPGRDDPQQLIRQQQHQRVKILLREDREPPKQDLSTLEEIEIEVG